MVEKGDYIYLKAYCSKGVSLRNHGKEVEKRKITKEDMPRSVSLIMT